MVNKQRNEVFVKILPCKLRNMTSALDSSGERSCLWCKIPFFFFSFCEDYLDKRGLPDELTPVMEDLRNPPKHLCGISIPSEL